MEQVFVESVILADCPELDGSPLTVDWINSNLENVVSEYEIVTAESANFCHLLNNQHRLIDNLEFVIFILHKYDIRKFYNELLHSIIIWIINLEYSFRPHVFNSDIMHDILELKPEFSRCINYLINGITNGLRIEDFLLSCPLLELLFDESNNVRHEIGIILGNPDIDCVFRCPGVEIQQILDPIVKSDIRDVIESLYNRGKLILANMCDLAVKHNNIDLLVWAREKNYKYSANTMAFAVKNNNMQMMDYLYNDGCPITLQACSTAAETGNLSALIWLRERHFPWNGYTCAKAAENGHLEVLHWAFHNGCRMDRTICECATVGGHLHILQWARSNNCPWDWLVCELAVMKGNLAILQWARENGCPWDKSGCIEAAKDQPSILEWVNSHE